VAALEARPGERILDLCGGTGGLSLEAARAGARVVCCDFSHPMLGRALAKFGEPAGGRDGSRPVPLLADALRLPFADGSFDAVVIGFGIRNLRTIEEGLGEILRVLRPGGRLGVLEFSRPSRGPLAAAYSLYLNGLLPRIGDAVSGREGPYRYLARTIGEFPPAEELAGIMRRAGCADVSWRALTGGIVAVHLGRRPAAGAPALSRG